MTLHLVQCPQRFSWTRIVCQPRGTKLMDSMAQIAIGLSKPFWIIRYKKIIYEQKSCRANYRLPKYSKIYLHTYFGMISTPVQLKKILPGPPRPSEIQSTQIFPKICKTRLTAQKSTLCVGPRTLGHKRPQRSASEAKRQTSDYAINRPRHQATKYRKGSTIQNT